MSVGPEIQQLMMTVPLTRYPRLGVHSMGDRDTHRGIYSPVTRSVHARCCIKFVPVRWVYRVTGSSTRTPTRPCANLPKLRGQPSPAGVTPPHSGR